MVLFQDPQNQGLHTLSQVHVQVTSSHYGDFITLASH